jgi:DNA-binding transcriptional MocR family regulator
MPLSLVEMTTMLGRWDRATGPLYSRLARAIARLLEGGQIASGTALPAERQLAAALSVSRTTVSAAYAELRRAGWLDARQGSATIVTGAVHSPVAAYKTNGLFASLMRAHPDVIDMTVAVPQAAPVVRDVLADPSVAGVDLDRAIEGHGYYPAGYPPLREALAQILTGNGLPTAPDELMVTSGAQQAISLVARATVGDGETVVVEEVTYPGALDLVTSRGAELAPVPITTRGIDVDALTRVIDTNAVRLVYLVPTFHNPTGSVLELSSRQRLVDTLSEHRVTTVDDLTLHELDHGDPSPPPLAALGPDAPIISVGSMSKVFWGGLRVGWVRARPPVIEHLIGFKTSADMGTSAIAQVVATASLTRYDETRRWRNQRLARSLETLVNAIGELLPDWDWQAPAGGPHLWVGMPPGGDATTLSHAALRKGLALVPGTLLAADESRAHDRIRLPLYPDGEALVAAVRIMAATWNEQRPSLAG